jgi:ribonuclease BN (tRNA processing enzyme)
VIEESPPQLLINVSKAIELGVKPSRKYRLLKHGFSVFTDEYDDYLVLQQQQEQEQDRYSNSNEEEMDDTTTISNTSSIKREVHPEQVMIPNNIKARKFAILGDTCHVTDAMKKLCQNVDLLVHEATLLDHSESVSK